MTKRSIVHAREAKVSLLTRATDQDGVVWELCTERVHHLAVALDVVVGTAHESDKALPGVQNVQYAETWQHVSARRAACRAPRLTNGDSSTVHSWTNSRYATTPAWPLYAAHVAAVSPSASTS